MLNSLTYLLAAGHQVLPGVSGREPPLAGTLSWGTKLVNVGLLAVGEVGEVGD